MLHVAAADLDNVAVLGHQGQLLDTQRFGHDEQIEFIGDGAQDLQSFVAQALEGVR